MGAMQSGSPPAKSTSAWPSLSMPSKQLSATVVGREGSVWRGCHRATLLRAMGNFDTDTSLTGSAGRYEAKLSEDWRVWGPAGGYVAAVALRAAGMEAQIKRPASFSGHFLRIGDFREVELEVTPLHAGRRSESIHVVMRQYGRPIFQGILRTAAAGDGL